MGSGRRRISSSVNCSGCGGVQTILYYKFWLVSAAPCRDNILATERSMPLVAAGSIYSILPSPLPATTTTIHPPTTQFKIQSTHIISRRGGGGGRPNRTETRRRPESEGMNEKFVFIPPTPPSPIRYVQHRNSGDFFQFDGNCEFSSWRCDLNEDGR